MIILLKNITAVLWELFLSFLDYMQFYGERKTRSTNIVRWSIAKLIIKVLKSNNKSNNCMYNYLIRAKKEKKGKKNPTCLYQKYCRFYVAFIIWCCCYMAKMRHRVISQVHFIAWQHIDIQYVKNSIWFWLDSMRCSSISSKILEKSLASFLYYKALKD